MWDGLGPILTIGLLLALRSSLTPKRPKSLILWLCGGIFLLILLPKQYPRLLLPVLPAAVCMVAVWLAGRSSKQQITFLALAVAWIHGGTVVQYPVSPLYQMGDDGCPQHWLRPPLAADFGLSEITQKVVESAPTGVWLVTDREVPCEIQTTHSLVTTLNTVSDAMDTVDQSPPRLPPSWTVGQGDLGA